ncbi:ThuA domain-containing protein [Sphingomonas sp. HHU CXW]|uniref:ThuA domain-containing protein n=1 Tax=Sphingomonas hominis TaxID=2741495 RepID=A0ABX2JIW9_9SPHN|nr:ThuA domain-containing protein [Sphingomonas hominis]NTS65566.1 ThuA domain-containing protein [Sphingomonas hominis]
MRRLLLAAVATVASTTAGADPQYKLLILAMPSKYHYEYIPVARDEMTRLAELHAFDLEWTRDPKMLERDLSGYAAVMLLNTPVEELDTTARSGFERYMNAGGNAMVVHRAAISAPGNWPWYEKLVGRTVGNHPMLQTGVVTVVDKRFPATFALPDRWVWSDEFYTTTNPYQVRINTVLSVDEQSYDPTKIWPGQVAKPMGRDHPIAWYQRYGRGRVFVTTLGHNGAMYRDERYLTHLMGGLYWTATGLGIAP